MKNCDPPQFLRSFLKKAVVILPLLLCMLVLAGVNTNAHAASLSTTKAADPPDLFQYTVDVYRNNTKLHIFQNCETNPSSTCPSVRIPAGQYKSECQLVGEAVSDGPYHNMWWVYIEAPNVPGVGFVSGWVSAMYAKTGDNDKPIPNGSPDCKTIPNTVWNTTTTAPPPPAPAPKSVKVLVFKDAEAFPCIYPASGRTAGCSSNGTVQPNNYDAYCQQQGNYYHEGGWTDRKNNWWTLIQNGNSLVWVSNLDIKGDAIIAGVPQGADACRANAPAGYPDGNYHP